MKKKAIFPGTFDPFTLGHKDIVDRALRIVDELVIAIGVNDRKETYFSISERIEMISEIYKNEDNLQVVSYSNLTVDFAKEQQAAFIIRGIRSINDFEYERNIADVNRELEGMDTLILFTLPEFAHISSSIVRELLKYKRDVTGFLPKEIDYRKLNK